MRDMTLDHSLPSDVEAERMILGVVLLDNNVMRQCVSALRHSGVEFFLNSHRIIYEKMLHLWETGEGIDPLTIQSELRRSGQLDQIGGPAYVASLFDGVPRFSNIESYLKLVNVAWLKRRFIASSNVNMARAFDGEMEFEEMIALAKADLEDLNYGGGRRRRSELFVDVMDRALDEANPGVRVATGFGELDYLLRGGGMEPGRLIIPAARTSRGKSTFANQIGMNVADRWEGNERGIPIDPDSRPVVLIFTIETKNDSLVKRMINLRSKISWESIQVGGLTDEERERQRMVIRRSMHWRLYLYDIRRVTLRDIQDEIRAVKNETGRLDLCIVDHLGLLKSTQRFKDRYLELADLTSGLKIIAGEKGCEVPMMVPTQIKRAGLIKDRFTLDDLRGSGDIEQDADDVWIIQEPEDVTPGSYSVEISNAKQREGSVGNFRATFFKTWGGFEELVGSHEVGLSGAESRRSSSSGGGGRTRSRRRPGHPDLTTPNDGEDTQESNGRF